MNDQAKMNLNNEQHNNDNKGVDYQRLVSHLLVNWYWLLLSLAVCLTLSFLYLKFKNPTFRIYARVLVNDEKKGGGLMAGAGMLGELGGLLGSKSTVDNEAEILKTRYLMEQVVKNMNLNITYFRKSGIKHVELYESPFTVDVITPRDTIVTTNIDVELLDNNKLFISTDDLDTTVAMGASIYVRDVGLLRFRRNTGVKNFYEKYRFNVMSVDSKVADLMETLTVEVKNKQITIVDLSLAHSIPKKGEDILSKLIEEYVVANLNDKNVVADSTVKFILNRLNYIGKELGDLEGTIQGFKQKNNLADMTEQSKLLVERTSQYLDELGKVETQVSILQSLQDYLLDKNNNKRVLPSSLVPADFIFNGAVEKYNSLTLERARKLIGATENNPEIILIDREIANARADIESNISTTLNRFIITRNKLRSQMEQAEGQVRNVPQIERNYLNLARQQQIKQELYIFLMQKSEETAISKTANIANSRTIDPPKSEIKPFKPSPVSIYLFGFIAGFAFPVGFFFLRDILNIKVQSKQDIAELTSVPIIGEIIKDADNNVQVVARSSRSAISEQFRALRTNLPFYLKSKDEKVILITSSMSGEGKSFVALNLGHVLAISNKRVLLMELDLRKPGLSKKIDIKNEFGFTNFIIDSSVDAKDIVQLSKVHENLHIVPSGPLPPNPAEMILNERTEILMSYLKGEYDYIIIDTPPIGIVADAQLLYGYANLSLYVVRQNVTLKKQLNIVEDLSKSNKMNNVGVVVNGIDVTDGSRYSNEYGYGYGYNEYFDDSSEDNKSTKL